MKHLKLQSLILSFTLLVAVAQAQKQALNKEPDQNRPRLFAQLPARIPVVAADLEKLIADNSETGKDISVDLARRGAFTFAGKVVSTASKYGDSIRSIVIRSTSFNGATFSLSSSVQADGTIRYTGRIISFKHADLYELQLEGNEYFLVKKDFYELVNE